MSPLRADLLRWVEEQEGLCAKATPGKWTADPFDGAWCVTLPRPRKQRGGSRAITVEGWSDVEAVANTHLIAASRTLLPLLLGAVRAEVEAHGDPDNPEWCGACGPDAYGDPIALSDCPTLKRLARSLGLGVEAREEVTR